MSYYWCRQTHTHDEILFDMKRDDGSSPSKSCIVDWNQFFRDITVYYFEDNLTKIGGPGSTVEIDETVITKGRTIGVNLWQSSNGLLVV